MSDQTPLRAPKFLIFTDRLLSSEQVKKFNSEWDEAAEAGSPVVLYPGFKVFAVNAEGQWMLLGSSSVIPNTGGATWL